MLVQGKQSLTVIWNCALPRQQLCARRTGVNPEPKPPLSGAGYFLELFVTLA